MPISEEARQQQEMLRLEPALGKGRFAKSDPTIVDGEDLDVPTFLRKKK
jgi:cell division protein FtsZ